MEYWCLVIVFLNYLHTMLLRERERKEREQKVQQGKRERTSSDTLNG